MTTKDNSGSKMTKQVTDLYHHLCPRYGTPTGFEYSSRRSDNTQSGIPQVTTHSPASHKGQHTVRHPTSDNTQSCIPQVTTQSGIPQGTAHSPALFPLAISQHFINTVTFRNSRPFVKICWLSPRIAHLKHTPKLYVHLVPNPRVSSMG